MLLHTLMQNLSHIYIGGVLHTLTQKTINYLLLAYLEMYGVAVQQVTVMHSSSIHTVKTKQ